MRAEADGSVVRFGLIMWSSVISRVVHPEGNMHAGAYFLWLNVLIGVALDKSVSEMSVMLCNSLLRCFWVRTNVLDSPGIPQTWPPRRPSCEHDFASDPLLCCTVWSGLHTSHLLNSRTASYVTRTDGAARQPAAGSFVFARENMSVIWWRFLYCNTRRWIPC